MGLRGIGASRLREAAKGEKPKKKQAGGRKKSRAGQVIDFLESLPITKGILQGKLMRLLPDQREFIEQIYSCRPDGKRKIKLAIKSEPKGNGKTGLIAGIALCHLLGPEAELRGEVYSAAIDRPQAALLFAEMEAIIFARADMAERVNITRFHKRMEVLRGDGKGSTYEALSADARRAHGLAPSLWVYDEIAQSKTRELFDNLRQGMSKRSEALGIVISTQAPDDEHLLSQLIDDAKNNADETTFLQLHAAPEDADPWDPAVWKAVNPAWGKFLDADDFKQAADQAKRNGSFEPSFRNLRLNQRIAPEEQHLTTSAEWKKGATPVNLDRLKGRVCYGGLDLSGKLDLTALVLVFPDEANPPGYDVLPFFWTPQEQLATRRFQEQERFKLWIGQGHIEAIPGPIIRYDFVARRIADLCGKYKIKAIAYDKWRIDDLKQSLSDIGFDNLPLEPFGQGHSQVMAPAIDAFIECATEGRLRHGGQPVLTASVLNATVIPDTSGNKKIDKSKQGRGPVRIDGAVSLVMAVGTAFRFIGEPARDFKMLLVG